MGSPQFKNQPQIVTDFNVTNKKCRPAARWPIFTWPSEFEYHVTFN